MRTLVLAVVSLATVLCAGLVAGALLDRDPAFTRGARMVLIGAATGVAVFCWVMWAGWFA